MNDNLNSQKNKHVRTLADNVIIALRKIIQAIDLNSKSLVKRFGLTGPQLVILKEIAGFDEISAGKIASEVSLSRGTVTGILDRMVTKNLISKRKDLKDKRRVMLSITEQGERLLKMAPPLMHKTFVDRFEKLQNWEQNMVLSSLQRLVSLMDAKSIDAAPFLAARSLSLGVTSEQILQDTNKNNLLNTGSDNG
jgi:DNA-binding MarR family transcriptional regulator